MKLMLADWKEGEEKIYMKHSISRSMDESSAVQSGTFLGTQIKLVTWKSYIEFGSNLDQNF